MTRLFITSLFLLLSATLFAQDPCPNATGQIIADSFYSDYDNYYQQCSGETMTFICQNVVLPDNGEIQSIRWRINETVIFDQTNDTLELISYNGLIGNLYADVFSTTGCMASFQLDLPILFIQSPIISLDETIGSCFSEGAPVSATISNEIIESQFTVFHSQMQFLDSDFDYINSIVVSGYDSPTITDCSMLSSVFVNMEHSYLDDLTIDLTCPNGTTISIFSDEPFVGSAHLGEPIDDETTTPGIGYTYEWTQNADSTIAQWVYYSYVNNNNILAAGEYLPSQSLCDLVGCPINGQWTLAINDAYAWDNGYVFSWGLSFENNGSTESYDPLTSSYNSFSWSSNEFSLNDQSATATTAIVNTNNQGTINYTYTNSAGCQVNKSKDFWIVDAEPTIMAGNDISFIDNANPLVESEIILLNSACSFATFDTTICFGNNANEFYTFCADEYFNCTDKLSISIYGETESFDTFSIWEGSDVSAEPLYQNSLSLGEKFFSTELDCFTIQVNSDAFASCGDAYFAPLEIALKSHSIPNINIEWEPSEYLANPDSVVSSISMPTENLWVTVTADIPNSSGCLSSDSLFVTIIDNSVILTVFHDTNENGILDSDENIIPYFPVTVGNVGTLFTNANGQAISALDEAESFNVSIDENQWNFTTPSFIVVDGAGWSGYAIEYFVGVSPTANLETDIEVSLEGVTGNCNINSYPQAIVFNNANYFPGGQIQIQLDPLYTFLSSEPSPISSANNLLVYDIPSLDYHGLYAINLSIINPAESNFGAEVSSVVNSYYYLSQGQLSEIIDTDSLNMIVTCAYDPNNKITHTGIGELNIIAPNTRLDYTINFQNIGNAEAQTVQITDQLPAELNPSTIQPIAWSHDFDLSVIDDVATFTFENIFLPGIQQDTAASMGFVRFTIEQVADLAPSTVIENSATIVFDTNDPIFTNTASNRIGNSIGITEIQSINFQLYPNPTSDDISWNNRLYRLNRINTISGQVISVPQKNLSTYNLSHLASGIYYFEFISNDGDRVKRTVIKQ